MLGMYNRPSLSIESLKNILEHCYILEIEVTIILKKPNKSTDNVATKTTNVKHIEKQTRFFQIVEKYLTLIYL